MPVPWWFFPIQLYVWMQKVASYPNFVPTTVHALVMIIYISESALKTKKITWFWEEYKLFNDWPKQWTEEVRMIARIAVADYHHCQICRILRKRLKLIDNFDTVTEKQKKVKICRQWKPFEYLTSFFIGKGITSNVIMSVLSFRHHDNQRNQRIQTESRSLISVKIA